MAGLGRKTFSPGDVLTSSDVQGYLMDQSVMVFAGTAARASAIPSPSAGMVAYSTATALQVYNGSAWVDASLGYGVASGTAALSTAITVAGTAYTLLTFTADSNLVVSKAGLFDVMLIGGGGGGGSWSSTANEGGGGAGGIAVATVYLAATTYAVDVGAGGAAQVRGFDSTLGSVTVGSTVAPTAVGGGGGSRNTQSRSGGSSGSGGNNNTTVVASVIGQGFAGGVGSGSLGDNQGAGGGGGAGAVGGNGTASVGGVGGAGISIASFIQTATTVAGGGGGNRYSGSSGAGGAGGGGAAGGTAAGTAGTANTGGGGGAGDAGAAGGSGVVYVRFKV